MAEIVSHALTNLSRVKARMGLTSSGDDLFLERLISSITDYIERECNRRFLRTTYTNEIYSVYGDAEEMIALNQTPVELVSAAQYRAGTVSNPTWTNFLADQWELVGSGASGLVKMYGGVPKGINSIRFTYIAGYKINFEAPTDPAQHTLPFDITELCENLVVKRYKKRDVSAGKSSEGFEGSSTSWESFITSDDREIINRYRRIPSFI